MKFKSIFILFNVTLLLFLAILVILPYSMFGTSFAAGGAGSSTGDASSFWKLNWPFILIWVFIFFVFNFFYFINRGLFLLLEKEDWPALTRYLEDRVIKKGKYSTRLVRLLANTYLVLSDAASVMDLENKVALAKPALVDANALVFGTARILGRDISGAVRFFETRKGTVKSALRDWVHWYYGFALLLSRRLDKAGNEFAFLARISKDGVITALSSYFLSEIIAPALSEREKEFREISSAGRERVLNALPGQKNWNREASRLSAEIHAAAVAKYLEEAGRWLYSAQ